MKNVQYVYMDIFAATHFHKFFFLAKMNWFTGYLSRVVRKPGFCIYGNKDTDQLHGNREADQRLRFRYTNSKIPLLPKSEISSF